MNTQEWNVYLMVPFGNYLEDTEEQVLINNNSDPQFTVVCSGISHNEMDLEECEWGERSFFQTRQTLEITTDKSVTEIQFLLMDEVEKRSLEVVEIYHLGKVNHDLVECENTPEIKYD